MPHPQGNVKLSGDTHLPDVESDLDVEEGTAPMADLARERTQTGRRGTHARKAGTLRAEDDTAADADGRAGADGTDDLADANGQPQRAMARQAEQPSPLALIGGGLLLLWLMRKILR